MRHLLTAINASIAQQNWYAALSLTLALPDICGWLEDPSAPTQDRYVSWFDRFVAGNYESFFLSGRDCYALRCAFLHEGREEIITQRAREVLDRFQFTVVAAAGLDDPLQSVWFKASIAGRHFLFRVRCWRRRMASESRHA